jgi:hypothetical protein
MAPAAGISPKYFSTQALASATSEIADVLHGRVREVFERADDLPVVRMVLGKEQLVDHVAGVPVRVVVDPLPFFVLYHGLLIDERLLRHRRQQVAQPVGLEPQRHLERVLWHDLEVDRLVG